MKKTIIVLAGLIASGKDATKKYIEEKYGAKSYRFSTILRDVLKRFDLPDSRNNLISLSTCVRQAFGDDLLAKAMASDVREATDEMIIVDGARRMNDLKYLREIPGFHLIRIDAKPEVRYERMIKRNENQGEGETSYEQFLSDHQKETEITIPEVMSNAEFSLDNNGDLTSLYSQIDKIIEKVKD